MADSSQAVDGIPEAFMDAVGTGQPASDEWHTKEVFYESICNRCQWSARS